MSGAPVPSAYNRALDALSRRARTGVELARWLRERDYNPDDIADAIERLTAVGLLDDTKYAASFARSRLVDRKLSSRRVRVELARRGVPRDVADAAVAATVEDEGLDEESNVRSIAARKMTSLAKLDRTVAQRRLTAFLARRGYASDIVQRVVRDVLR